MASFSGHVPCWLEPCLPAHSGSRSQSSHSFFLNIFLPFPCPSVQTLVILTSGVLIFWILCLVSTKYLSRYPSICALNLFNKMSYVSYYQYNIRVLNGISYQFSSVQFSRSVVSDSLRPHESQHARPPCPSPTPGVHSNSRPSSW